jgi:hypothetical protein
MEELAYRPGNKRQVLPVVSEFVANGFLDLDLLFFLVGMRFSLNEDMKQDNRYWYFRNFRSVHKV